MKPSAVIVGCGRVGTALARFLSQAGYRMTGFASKSLSSARGAAEAAGGGEAGTAPWELTRDADMVFLTTPDGVIEPVCATIAENDGFRARTAVLHCSGALPSTILSSAKAAGADIGSMHPLQSFASKDILENPFAGVIVSVEGDDRAAELAAQAAGDLGAVLLPIQTGGKGLYHAAAVAASNYLVTLMDFAFGLMAQAGVSEEDAFKVLKPLIFGTLGNIARQGPAKALTGPIARGDAETVAMHLREIRAKAPDLLRLYKILGARTIPLAKAGPGLTDAAEARLKALLETDAAD